MKASFTFLIISLFVVSCKKEQIPPLAPSNLTAFAESTSAIKLNWTDLSNNETNFILQRKTGAGSFVEIARVPKNITNYSDSGLKRNTLYTYRVYAYNNGGQSANSSNEASANTFDDPPIAPGVLTVTVGSSKSLRLNWIDNSINEFSFIIERRNGTASFSSIATLAANTISYIDTPLVTNTTYYYRVKAIDNNKNGNYSNEASGTPIYLISGLTWTKVVSGVSVRVIPNFDSSIIMLARTSDVLKSSNNGQGWITTNYPSGIVNDYGSGYSPNLGGQWCFGTNGEGWITTSDGGNTFANNGPRGGGCGSFFVQGVADGTFLASKTGFLRGIYKSSGANNSIWSNKYPGIDPRGIAISGNTIFVAAGSTSFFKSTNNGDTWISVLANSISNDVTLIGDTLYWINESSDLFKSSINNLTSGISIKNFGEAPNTMWQRMAYDPSTKIMVVASPTKGIFISRDMGQTWVNYQMPSAGYYYTATIIKEKIFVCTDIGLFVSSL